MPSVIISKNSQFVGVHQLQSQIHIGRNPSNDIVLDAAGISRTHASIEQQQDQFFLVDTSSTNGTFVGDQRVQRCLLTNGTSFRILDYLLTFVDDVHPQGIPSDEPSTATLIDHAPQQLQKNMRFTEAIGPNKSLQEKTYRTIQMVCDLMASGSDTDPGSFVLEALLEITSAKRGIIAIKQKGADPTITHSHGFDLQTSEQKASLAILMEALEKGTAVYRLNDQTERPVDGLDQCNFQSVLCVPIIIGGQTIGCIYLDHPDDAGVFSQTDHDLLVASAEYIGDALVPNKRPSGKLTSRDQRLADALKRQGIIAQSPKTLKVFKDCQTIARYNVSVLVYGETGTGKEIIARYIHDLSDRRGKFIAFNCSAIAASMFESELFGHEKGAFTGAVDQKQGIFELADGGTLFLDEIGDMPAELQTKMLRALQEQEVWRVGGTAPVQIDVQVIAATHQDIKSKRKQLNFRDDLYYRLANVEITTPSLRERPEDIAPLCEMIFADLEEDISDKNDTLCLSQKVLHLLEAYDWPGNVRELRNTLIQVRMRCDGKTVEPRHLKGLVDVYAASSKPSSESLPTLLEVERVHIIKALKQTNGNKSAAAKILAIDRNRLNRRLKKLGIES